MASVPLGRNLQRGKVVDLHNSILGCLGKLSLLYDFLGNFSRPMSSKYICIESVTRETIKSFFFCFREGGQ